MADQLQDKLDQIDEAAQMIGLDQMEHDLNQKDNDESRQEYGEGKLSTKQEREAAQRNLDAYQRRKEEREKKNRNDALNDQLQKASINPLDMESML